MGTEGGITVRRALELPGLRVGLPEVVASAEGLDRMVRWVHAGEAPNLPALLKGGELLLTTGLGIGTRPADQRAYVRRLADRGIAALVVELGPRFGRLPGALVDAARTTGLPLVQLHREVPFVAVTEEIHTEIVNGHYALLRRAEEVHLRCTRAVLGGGGAAQVLEILADFTGNPAFLETADGRLLYAAAPGAGARAAGERRAGPDGAGPLQVGEGLRGGREAREAPPAGAVLVEVPGGGAGGGAVRARLVLLAVAVPTAAVHRMAAERAAELLAVVLMQARQEEELAARGRGDFLTDLAEGRVASRDAPAQAGVLGFRPGCDPLLPVVMRLAPEAGPSGGWSQLARAVTRELAAVGTPVLLGVRPAEGKVLVLLALRPGADRTAQAGRAAAALRAGVERAGLERAGGRAPVVVAGATGGWESVGAGLRHAAEAARAAQGLPERPWHDARRLDVDLLLWRLRDHPDLAAFVDRTIGPLLAHDRTSRPALLPTLEAYVAHTGRKAETARGLHLNRQTLYNRLARIGELLGTDLDDPQTVLALSLALRARRHTA
ncbi:PucR family transcriptional regulator [Streptomyces nitrosporeus]|uniref:PucR family transcriptional regulator n=1 Tax=Streptomyces nitrosporeus TaxID=28894 RepID=A0A5J6FGR7_9ACTN|nr:PucR family transcriptional regulator [Streptomyces nitrosporeus]QEU75211.1 PucR family transcriptional regulator [Streptomyces nitrosporeus]GGZ19306.1 transcriptional regulator [Streptomyces nitrosporeus]